jgi:gamma-glutamylaminecyclotransferase
VSGEQGAKGRAHGAGRREQSGECRARGAGWTLVFVYGTLKRGRENHRYLREQEFVAEARTAPEFRLYNMGGYPGMVWHREGLSIQGEIWSVDEATLARLDVLEDIAGGEYVREIIPLASPHESWSVQGYRYLLSVAGRPEVGECW